MVPKKLPDGTITRDPAKMRPITVLPTLGKLGPSIIADRIGDALVRYPDVLSLHQRAHRRDGSVDQGVNTVVDIIEDWQGRDSTTREPLYLVSYDQRKAFDKVQKFTIRASMERLNMPEPLILFVLSSLTNAKSRVRTYDGLTKSFTLRSSVRQGDPLSALLYNIVTDALHEGLLDNPLFPASAKQGGYTFAKPHQLYNTLVRICSVGYADDTIIVATCPQRLAEMHAWVRAFFGANSFRLNVEKSEFLCSDPKARTAAPTLASVDGSSSIVPQPVGHTIRYLGARINLDLDWSKELQRMHGMVYATCANLRTHQFTLPMSAYVIGQYLLPRLRLGLSLVTLTDDVRKRIRAWDYMLRQASMTAAGMRQRRVVSPESLYLVSGIPSLEEEAMITPLQEYQVSLCSKNPAACTAWARWASHTTPRKSKTAGRGKTLLKIAARLLQVEFNPTAPEDLTPPTLPTIHCTDAASARDAAVAWIPGTTPTLFTVNRDDGATPAPITIYTDGSTVPGSGAPSGCSAVTVTANGTLTWSHVLVVDTRGDNFASEVIATLAAILGVPLDVDLLIVTDALSALQSIHYGRTWDWGLRAHLSSFGIPDRKRILAAMRPYITYIRLAITQRTGRTTLEHVRSHSDANTTHALGNDRADKAANEARRAVTFDWVGPNVQDTAACEPITVSTEAEDYGIVLGALRPRLLTERIKAALDSLASRAKRSPRAADLADTHGRRILSWTNAARYSRSGELMKLVILALTQALPSEHVLWQARKHTNNDNRGPSCKLCGHPEDTNEHALCRCTNREVTAARTYACTLAADAFRYADNDETHHTGPALMDVSALSAGPSKLVRAWFDPSRQLMLEVCPQVPAPTLQNLESFCPLAGMLGILPKGVRSILSFAKVPGGWRRCSYAEIEDRAQAVRLAIMRGCLHVWQIRYRQFVKWWWSDASTAVAARTASAAARVKQNVNRASVSIDKDTHTPRSKKHVPAPGGPKCSACGKPGHNVRTCRANPAPPLSDDHVDKPPVLPPIPGAAIPPPLPANLPAPRLCSTCSTPGHDKRNCPDKPVRTPGTDGRHSSFTCRSPEAMLRTHQPFFLMGGPEADRWGAEVATLDARWLHDPPAAY
jgi:hypothetical protein